MSSYLQNLTVRLTSGMEQVAAERRERHTRWIVAQQRADGGFAGRDAVSDLYYTSFALRSLAITGELYGDVAQRTAAFLSDKLTGRETIVDFLSLMYSAALLESAAGIDIFAQLQLGWQEAVSHTLENLRRDDGGYAKGPEGTASSTYHSFLVLLCLQLIDRPVPQPERLIEFLQSQRAADGGFREIRASKRAGTNPTAAAVGALQILNALDAQTRAETIELIVEMQTDEGGLRANTRIPIADLLSSFTGFWTLDQLQARDCIDTRALRRYALSLEEDSGGFRGAEWDQACDVEYTFYGLGLMALLA